MLNSNLQDIIGNLRFDIYCLKLKEKRLKSIYSIVVILQLIIFICIDIYY